VKIGYVRTSKKEQNPEMQRRELEAAGCERLFEESISSRKEDRPQLRAALDYCREATPWSCGSSTGSDAL
jgi:DNA invertase Pin-like site-specific DNA recombinase